MEPVFKELGDDLWNPSEYARGPFAGLAGGAVAGLLAATIERRAAADGLGAPLTASVQFLRPAPLATLRTATETLRTGRRVSVLRAQLFDGGTLLAIATVSFVRPAEVPEVEEEPPRLRRPAGYATAPPRPTAPGGPWFMDTFDFRVNEGAEYWFRTVRPVTSPLTPLARVLGPADWTHGLGRPLRPRVPDPNIDLTVQLTRLPLGEWIGIRPRTRRMRTGVGRGHGVLLDEAGEIGGVSMGVTLLPPAPAPTA